MRILGVLMLAAAAAACGGRPATADATSAPEPVVVGVAEVEGVDEAITIEATGSFQADEASDVAPDASGRVIATPVDVGQFVREGAPLIRIQGITANLRLDEARAAVQRAEANVRLAESQNALAQTTAQRYQALLATGDVSKTVADQARTQAETTTQSVATARASLAETRAQLSQAEKAVEDVVVSAPFSGFISARNVSLGEYVQPSTPVVRLLKLDPMRLQLTIPAVQAGQVTTGQRVVAQVDAYPDRAFEGQITAINPAISPESRALTVEARVPNRDAALRPGMFAVATIDQGRTERAMLVPRRAVIEDVNTNSHRVYVVDDQGRARLRVIQLAPRQHGERLRILTGVSEGERVATSSLAELYDGAAVRIDR